MKKLVLFICTAILSLEAIPEAIADETCPTDTTSCGTNCCYTINNGHITFSRIDESKTGTIASYAFQKKGIQGELIIPSWITSIGAWAFNNNSITSLVVPESVTSINSYAFFDNSLTSAIIPASVTGFGADNFRGNPITEITFTEGVNAGRWDNFLFYLKTDSITSIKCIKPDGTPGDDKKCITGLARYLPDENGKCKTTYCLKVVTKVGNTCVGTHIQMTDEEDTCINKSDCVDDYYISKKTNQCTPMPEGCAAYDDFCEKCKSAYLFKEGKCIPASQGCGENYRQFEDFCNRIRYTPVEAAEILNNDDNQITITFKM